MNKVELLVLRLIGGLGSVCTQFPNYVNHYNTLIVNLVK